jgi:CRP-like cAMP-binding protein
MKAVFKSTAAKDPARDFSASYAAGETIFREGELGTEMFIVQEGEVQITKTLAGDSHVVSVLEKGDFFGEMAILEDVPRSADAIALTDVKLITINGSRFDEMLRKNPEIAVRIIRKYSKRLREANALLDRLAGQAVDAEHSPPYDSTQLAKEKARSHRLVDLASGDAFYLANSDTTTIGRSDPVTGIRPDIDLSSIDQSRSVSRRHAKIIRQAEGYAIFEDVGTVNGTFVNDQRIPTGVAVPIRHGDRVKIGLVEMKVVYEG